MLWLGDRSGPDEQAAVQPAYAAQLTSALTERGHLIEPPTDGSVLPEITDNEPAEAAFARHGKRVSVSADGTTTAAGAVSRNQPNTTQRPAQRMYERDPVSRQAGAVHRR